MKRLVPPTVLPLLFAEVVLLVSAFLIPTYLIVDVEPVVWLQFENGIARIGLVVAVLMLGLYMQDLYSDLRVRSRFRLVQQVALAAGLAFLSQAFVSYVDRSLVMPRKIMLTGGLVVLVVLPAWRVFYSRLVVHRLAAQRVLFLGASEVGRRVAQRISEQPEMAMSVVGFLVESEEADLVTEGPILGRPADFRAVVKQVRPELVVVGFPERRGRMPINDLLEVRYSGVAVEDAATTFEAVFKRVSIPQLRPSQLVFTSELGPRPLILDLQAIYSFLIAAAVLVVAAPLMLLTAVLVRLTSTGPALYRQKRMGLNGEVFTLYKFRSMRVDAEAHTGAVWASRDDPRITPLGRILRKTRIDELPQLFNVLRGDMALVGPRPERPEFVAALTEQIPFYRQRLCVKPGISGWAQINHKYGDTIEDTITKLEYDLYYIKHLSPIIDFYVIFQTIKVMLLTRGAQ